MTKLVVLRLEGDLSQGVQVRLEIGEEGDRASIEMTGSLPAALDMTQVYDQWQDGYLRLGRAARITPGLKIIDGNITPEKCLENAELVRSRLNEWLSSPSFVPIWKKLLQQLQPDSEVRVLIRTNSEPLRKLPWQLWDLIEDYHKAEVALSATEYERPASDNRPRDRKQVKILAILGDSTEIDVGLDRQVLENLPHAATTFLVEPKLEDINDQLWDQDWDILFFAGHSRSEGESGRIFINENESLRIDELKRGLETVVRNGLQLAIFNSCDGLGLARALQRLQIPQLIVMREPVPDEVAQRYLKYFLKAFTDGEKLYIAERTARRRLEGLERKYPCASWLPVIFQHPAVVPPTWNQLCGVSSEGVDNSPRHPSPLPPRRSSQEIISTISNASSERSSSTALDKGTQLTRQELRNRRDLLAQVKRDVNGGLEQSLHKALSIKLHKEMQPQQVTPSWSVDIKAGNLQTIQLPPNTEIIEVFDQEAIAGKLLILGAPGSGKTTTLLELARELIRRAESDPDQPMPVWLNLSSWKDDNQTIAQWVVAELNSNYDVPKAIGQQWLDNRQLLPLLDGLDELNSERQVPCIEAINQFGQKSRLQPMVVCTRLEQYEFCRTKLKLNGAICLQPLSSDQIRQYLEQAEQSQLWQIINDDRGLWELAKSPLLLRMMTLAYQEISPQEWQRLNSFEERRRYLFDAYFISMVKRDIRQKWYASGKEPTEKQTRRWLGYLAKMLKQEAQTEFLIEKMQPHWLQSPVQKRLYRMGVGLITGLIYGLSIHLVSSLARALVVGLSERSIGESLRGLLWILIAQTIPKMTLGLPPGLLWAIIGWLCQGWTYSLIGGLILGPIYGLIINSIFPNAQTSQGQNGLLNMLLCGIIGGIIVGFGEKVKPVETLGWSWKKARFYGLICGLILGLFAVPYLISKGEPVLSVLLSSLFGGQLIGFPIGALIGGIAGPGIDKEKRTIPNQGIRQSAANAIIFLLIIALSCGLLFKLLQENQSPTKALKDQFEGLVYILSFCVLIPGFACIQHFSLRAVLCWCGLIPWDYARFLNYATEILITQIQLGSLRHMETP